MFTLSNRLQNRHLKLLAKILIIGICVALVFWLLRFVFPVIAGRNIGTTQFGENLPVTEPDNFVLVVNLHDVPDELRVELRLNAIILPRNSNFSKQVCIEKIHIDDVGPQSIGVPNLPHPKITDLWKIENVEPSRSSSSSGGRWHQPINFVKALCTQSNDRVVRLDIGAGFTTGGSLVTRNLYLNDIPEFFFPIDGRFFDSSIWLEATDGRTFAPEIIGLVTSPNWDERITVSNAVSSDGIESDETVKEFSKFEGFYFRPLAYRILAVILLLALLTFIVVLIFVNDISSFLEVSIGILLGLWGVQAILVPSNITSPTMIEGLLLTLYVLFAFAIFIRFVVRPIWVRLGKNSRQKLQSEQNGVSANANQIGEDESTESDNKQIEIGDEPLQVKIDATSLDVNVKLPEEFLSRPIFNNIERVSLSQKVMLMSLTLLTLFVGLLFIKRK